MAPTLLEALDLEYAIHAVPKAHRDDIKAVFPTLTADQLDALKIVSTCQRAREDLVKMGEKIENEKDRLLRVVSTHTTYGPQRPRDLTRRG